MTDLLEENWKLRRLLDRACNHICHAAPTTWALGEISKALLDDAQAWERTALELIKAIDAELSTLPANALPPIPPIQPVAGNVEQVLRQAKESWDTEADEYNKWESLGEDEKLIHALKAAGALQNPLPIKSSENCEKKS